MMMAACGIVLTASLNPGYRAGWLGGFQLSQYPLAGLELKALALAWLLWMGREPGRKQSDQAHPLQNSPLTLRFSEWREVGLAGAIALALFLLPKVPVDLPPITLSKENGNWSRTFCEIPPPRGL